LAGADSFTHFWAEAKPTKAAPTRAETTENFMVLVLVWGMLLGLGGVCAVERELGEERGSECKSGIHIYTSGQVMGKREASKPGV
jgi:hypothetical protein